MHQTFPAHILDTIRREREAHDAKVKVLIAEAAARSPIEGIVMQHLADEVRRVEDQINYEIMYGDGSPLPPLGILEAP